MTQLNLNDNNNAIIIDMGANIGIYTILLSHIYPNAKIIAIEASPTTFEMLKSLLKIDVEGGLRIRMMTAEMITLG